MWGWTFQASKDIPAVGITSTKAARILRAAAHKTSISGRRTRQPAAELPPLLDLQIIRNLAEAIDSPAVAAAFLSDYFALLPDRLDRVLAGIQAKNADYATDAITSLRSSSAMTGAARAEASCRTMEAMIRSGSFKTAKTEAKNLSAVVAEMLECAPFLVQRAEAGMGYAVDNDARKAELLAA